MATRKPSPRGPGRPRRRDGATPDDLRDRLLDMAVTLFARDGVGPTTLAAIARTGYDGFITVELYPYIADPDAAAREAYVYLMANAKRLGLKLDK